MPFTQPVRRGVVTHCADSPPWPSVRARPIGACMRHGIDDVAALYGELSRRDLVSIVEMSHRCVEARTCSDVAEVIDRLGTLLSFRKAAACSVLANGDHAGMQHFINHSYGSAWADLYTERNYVAVDPVIQHALRVDGAFEWREAFGSGAAESASEFLDAARDFGLGKGVSFSCRTGRMRASRTVLSLSLDDPGECKRAKLLLIGVGPHVHEAYVRVRAQRADDACRAVLTNREKEVLDWAKQGKTYWEIGRILGISQRTVKFHFANIKARLDVVSECHAVAKAMSMGLIA